MADPLTVDDLLASAVATRARPAAGQVGADTMERLRTVGAAMDAGLEHWPVRDVRCCRDMTLVGFIRHCAQVDHIIRDVHSLPGVDSYLEHVDPEPFERDLGRQGESRTAVQQ